MLIKRKRWFKIKSKHPYCFGLVGDGTSELFHTKKSAFILKSFIQEEEVKDCKVNERFLTFLDFEKIKTEDIAHVIFKFLHNTLVYKHLRYSN